MDAGPFNNKTNSIASLIVGEEVKCIEGFRETVASGLKNKFNCEVLYGTTLVKKPGYIELATKYNFPEELNTGNEHFPKIIIPKDETNFFQFTKGKVEKFLEDAKVVKPKAAEICKSVGTDYIAVSYSTLAAVGFGMFGGHGNICLYTYLFIFDKEGDLVFQGDNHSKPVRVVGDDLMEYKAPLNSLSEALPKILEKAAKKMTSK